MPYQTLNVRRAVRQLKWTIVTLNMTKLSLENVTIVELEKLISSMTTGKWVTSATAYAWPTFTIALENPADATMITMKWGA